MASAGLVAAEGDAPSAVRPAQPAPRAWLGVQLAKPDRSVTVHVPSLPPGIGFVVTGTDEEGPARAAGIREYDLLWKLGDQMLVNEAQLAALLRLSKPGDEVTLSGFRGGKPLEVKLKLGDATAARKPVPGEVVDAAVFPSDYGVPMRVINVSEKSASLSTDAGRAVVRRDEDGYRVTIRGLKNEEIFDGTVPSDRELGTVPDAWQRRVRVLCRSLDQAMAGNEAPPREPKSRIIPSSLSKP